MAHNFKVGNHVKYTGKSGVIVELKTIGHRPHAVVQFSDYGETIVSCEHLEKPDQNPVEKVKCNIFDDYPEDFYLHLTATRLKVRNQSEPYTFLANSCLELQPHQVFVAHRVTQKLNPRCILADEVGLGKTIEAGMILKELKARGLVDKTLIVVPASLVSQWQWEMKSKFNEHFTVYDRETLRHLEREHARDNPWKIKKQILVSLHLARREEVAAQIADIEWDMVIFDEAHHLRRKLEGFYGDEIVTTKAYRLASELVPKTKSMLLLTATPLQLHDFEFYSLTDLVDPTLFHSYPAFQKFREKNLPRVNSIYDKLLSYDDLDDSCKIDLAAALAKHMSGDISNEQIEIKLRDPVVREKCAMILTEKHPLANIMIRNRKKNVGGFARRQAFTLSVDLTLEERNLYEEVLEYVVSGYEYSQYSSSPVIGFLLVIFQKRLTSSTHALKCSMKRRLERVTGQEEFLDEDSKIDLESFEDGLLDVTDCQEEIIYMADFLTHEAQKLEEIIQIAGRIQQDSKLIQLQELLQEVLSDPDEKVLIFTQFFDTLEYLQKHLEKDASVVVFHGRMNAEEKDRAADTFKQSAQVMISTDAGGEGRNFQFCHRVVNYDLPWNPMKVEQRIGRVDRFGQKSNVVYIYNFSISQTIEDRVYRVLNDRINLFEETIGGLEPILGDIERQIQSVVLGHKKSKSAFSRFEKDVSAKVFRAKEMENKMKDFIMDTRSYVNSDAQEVMLKDTREFYMDIQSFTFDFLSRYPDFTYEQVKPNVFRFEVPRAFLEKTQTLNHKFQLAPVREVYHAAFSPEVASENENTAVFIAFGNELLEYIIHYCMHELPHNTAAYSVRKPEGITIEETFGCLFNFLVTFSGVHEKQKVISVYVTENGDASVDMGMRVAALKPEATIRKDSLPSLDINYMLTQAEEVVYKEISSVQKNYEVENSKKLQEEREHIVKFSDYQINKHLDSEDKNRRQIEKIEREGTREQKRIIPVWQDNIKKDNREIERWAVYKETKLSELGRFSRASCEFRNHSIAVIQLL